jgi:hypothetical protein
MAEPVLQRIVHLGHALLITLGQKYRVVAEAAAAAAFGEDLTVPARFRDQWSRVVGVLQQHQHADEERAALLRRYAIEFVQQLGVVRRGVAVGVAVARR